jgi:SWI/SNF-related matrix-associated actin-dependent regulator of chromatin subfamily A member 5
MLDRIRRKLFLSLKVMGGSGDSASSDTKSGLGTSELMDILRKGSSALSRDDNDGLDLDRFLSASVDEIMDVSRRREGKKDVKMKCELGDETVAKEEQDLMRDIEAEEKKLLSGIAQVHSRLFEGRIVNEAKMSNKDIAKEWLEVQMKARNDQIVSMDGIQVIADHVGPLPVSFDLDCPSLR